MHFKPEEAVACLDCYSIYHHEITECPNCKGGYGVFINKDFIKEMVLIAKTYLEKEKKENLNNEKN